MKKIVIILFFSIRLYAAELPNTQMARTDEWVKMYSQLFRQSATLRNYYFKATIKHRSVQDIQEIRWDINNKYWAIAAKIIKEQENKSSFDVIPLLAAKIEGLDRLEGYCVEELNSRNIAYTPPPLFHPKDEVWIIEHWNDE